LTARRQLDAAAVPVIYHRRREVRHRVLRSVMSSVLQSTSSSSHVPSLYVLNASSLAKPHAVEQLAADIGRCNNDVAIISETNFKSRHLDSAVSVPGYTLLRRDRIGKRCGGVVLYIRESYNATMWTFSADDRKFKLLLVLYNSLPNETVSFYELRHRPHNRELIYKTSRLAEASFIVRMLYKDISHTFLYDFSITFSTLFYL